VLVRGSEIGDYVYPFIDVGTIGFAQAFINALGVLAGFVAMGLVLWGVDRFRGRSLRAG
jgi:high-affinity Fe2+/Pb2+ permease